MTELAVRLIPRLANSLAEQFNIFWVMHHGTHEKQLSNVFSWLLDPGGTHHLGDVFQRIFVASINEKLDPGEELPSTGYRIAQEVDTSGGQAQGRDIADIVLTRSDVRIVVENFFTSDGHGHSYDGYLTYGSRDGRRGVVILLAISHEPYRQTDGWQHAPVLTYSDILQKLQEHLAGQKKWRREHREQHFFIRQLIDHYVEGPRAVSTDENLEFIMSMCETGESARYARRPIDDAAEAFAQQMAQHAKHQFHESRNTLRRIKRTLRSYTEHSLKHRINTLLGGERLAEVRANWVGQWEWTVRMKDQETGAVLGLTFGPSIASFNEHLAEPIPRPDFSRVHIFAGTAPSSQSDVLVRTDLTLRQVLAGLDADDAHLRDHIIRVLRDH